jgi:hypothetical protein
MIKLNKNDKLKRIKSILEELLVSSTSHGIPNAIRSKHVSLKIMWLIFFLISTGFCALFIILSFMEYSEYNVITTVRIINEIPTDFAQIKICNLNPYTTNYSYQMLQSISSRDITNYTLSNMTRIQTLKTKAMYYFGSSNFSEANRKKLSYSLNDMLISCKFNNLDCNENDYERTYSPYFGNCFTFNSGRNSKGEKLPKLKNMVDGSFHGLNLVLYVGIPDYFRGFYEYFGVKIFVSNSSLKSMFENEISVTTGAETSVILQRTFLNQLPYPYSNCHIQTNQNPNIESEIYKKIIQSNFSYTQRDCAIMCYQFTIEQKCKCYDLLFPPINAQIQCEVSDSCYVNQANGYSNNLTESDAYKCIKSCPIECSKEIFTYTTSQVNSLSQDFAENYLNHEVIKSKFVDRTPTFNDIKNGLVSLKIYYDTLSYTEIQESPSITEISLVSNIGGTLGLFLGISLLSFIEIFEILFEIIFIMFKK